VNRHRRPDHANLVGLRNVHPFSTVHGTKANRYICFFYYTPSRLKFYQNLDLFKYYIAFRYI
jgi:hypothetical protein